MIAQGFDQALSLQRRRSQLAHQTGEFALGLLRQSGCFIESGSGAGRIALEQGACRRQLHGGGEHLLLHAVVEVARQSVTLLQGGQFLAGLEQVLQLLRHPIEMTAQLTDLVGGAIFGQGGEVTMAPGVGCLRQPVEASRQPASGESTEDGADGSRQNREGGGARRHQAQQAREGGLSEGPDVEAHHQHRHHLSILCPNGSRRH